jgi:hypothetical protein
VSIATHLRSFQLIGVADDLLSSNIWPPLHGLVLGIVLAVGNVDPRLAIVPSLLGWSATVIVSTLVAYRLAGVSAAAICCVFVAGSPAFRLLGSDVMLEGLGAGLSALGLYLFLRAMEQPADSVRWRALALVLTLLFFEKYNYWMLLLVSLGAAALFERPKAITQAILDFWTDCDPVVLKRLLRHPLMIAAYAATLVTLLILFFKPEPVELFGRRIVFYPPGNPATVAYALAFCCVAHFAWRHRATIAERIDPVAGILLRWHLLPIAVSLLWPARLPWDRERSGRRIAVSMARLCGGISYPRCGGRDRVEFSGARRGPSFPAVSWLQFLAALRLDLRRGGSGSPPAAMEIPSHVAFCALGVRGDWRQHAVAQFARGASARDCNCGRRYPRILASDPAHRADRRPGGDSFRDGPIGP